MKLTPKRFTCLIFLALFLYLSLYTWNLRTGYLDALASNTGLEFVTSVLRPGQWVRDRVVGFWDRYIYLVGVREENENLARELNNITWELHRNREAMHELERLRHLFSFIPPPRWEMTGARVVAHRMGPHAALDTIVLDKGFAAGAKDNAPVATPRGVVGRVLRKSAHAANVLLLTDPNSRIAVRGRTNRTAGILAGRGSDAALDVLYVPLNEPLEEGEILVTSGLAGIFPAGLPAARVVSIERSDISLFQTVHAEPLEAVRDLEEVALLLPPEDFPPEAPVAPVALAGDGPGLNATEIAAPAGEEATGAAGNEGPAVLPSGH